MPSQSTEPSTRIGDQPQPSASIQDYDDPVLPETDGSRTGELHSTTTPPQGTTTQPSISFAAKQLANAIWARACSFGHSASSQVLSSRKSPRILPTEARDTARDATSDYWRSLHNQCKRQVGLASECLDVTREIAKEIKQNISWKGQPSAKRIGSRAVKTAKDTLGSEKEWMAYITKRGRKAGIDLGTSIDAPSVPSDIREIVKSNFSDVSCTAEVEGIISPKEKVDYMSGVEQLLKERFLETIEQ